MAKKVISEELTAEFKKTLSLTKLVNVEVDSELRQSFIDYAMAVNRSRAIPDVRDGLKPVLTHQSLSQELVTYFLVAECLVVTPYHLLISWSLRGRVDALSFNPPPFL